MRWIGSFIFLVFLMVFTPAYALFASPALLLGERVAIRAVKLWAYTILGALKVLCGVSHRVEGIENIPNGPTILASNHLSMWETIAMMTFTPKPCMAFKREFQYNPVYGVWGTQVGVPVDREGGPKSLKAFVRAAQKKLEAGAQFIIFPEGTRVPLGERRKLHPGIAAVYKVSNVPCVPVVHNSAEFWRHPGPLKIPGEIVIRFLPPIAPGLHRKRFIAKLDETLATARSDLSANENAEPPQAAAAGA